MRPASLAAQQRIGQRLHVTEAQVHALPGHGMHDVRRIPDHGKGRRDDPRAADGTQRETGSRRDASQISQRTARLRRHLARQLIGRHLQKSLRPVGGRRPYQADPPLPHRPANGSERQQRHHPQIPIEPLPGGIPRGKGTVEIGHDRRLTIVTHRDGQASQLTQRRAGTVGRHHQPCLPALAIGQRQPRRCAAIGLGRQHQRRHAALHPLQRQRTCSLGHSSIQRLLKVASFDDGGQRLDVALEGLKSQAFLRIAAILVMKEPHVMHRGKTLGIQAFPNAQRLQELHAGRRQREHPRVPVVRRERCSAPRSCHRTRIDQRHTPASACEGQRGRCADAARPYNGHITGIHPASISARSRRTCHETVTFPPSCSTRHDIPEATLPWMRSGVEHAGFVFSKYLG